MSIDSAINLRNDIIFKYVFGYEKNERILVALLNAILGLEDSNRIIKLTFLNAINLKECLNDKLTSLDVKAEDSTGKRYNIEMQVKSEPAYISRVIYYHDRLFTTQLKETEPFEELNKTIAISILCFILLPEEAELHNIYRYLNIKSKRELTDIKEIHFIELPKFKKDKPKKLRSKFEKWLHIMKFGEVYASDINNLPEELLEEEEIVMALQEMVRASNDDVVRELLEMRSKARHEEASRLYQARQEERLEMAKKMLNDGLDIHIISKYTGLSVNDINNLK